MLNIVDSYLISNYYCRLLLGQSHYELRTHNITASQMDQGRREHAALLSTFDDSKKVVNAKHFFLECYRFNRRAFYPCVVPIDYVITYMIQSGNYVLSPDFINAFRKIDLGEASTYWDMIHEPQDSTVEDVRQIIFDIRSYDKRASKRYFTTPQFVSSKDNKASSQASTAPTGRASANDDNNSALMSSDDDGDRQQDDTNNTTTTASSRAQRLVELCRRQTESSEDLQQRLPNYPTEDFVLLPPPHEDSSCPATLNEMMNIIKTVRSKKLKETYVHLPIHDDPTYIINDDEEQDQFFVHSSQTTHNNNNKIRINNYSMFTQKV